MIITIQKSTKGYTVTFIDTIIEFETMSLQQVTKELGKFSDNYFKHTEERPTIKILPMERTPVMRVNPGFIKAVDNFINSNTPMATKKTYPAKKKAVVKKVVKKAVKKAGKK